MAGFEEQELEVVEWRRQTDILDVVEKETNSSRTSPGPCLEEGINGHQATTYQNFIY